MLRAWKQKKKEGSMPCVMILWDANFLQKTFLAIRVQGMALFILELEK